MSVLEIIRRRRSVRKFKEDPVPEDVLLRVLEAARLAPSAKNIQPWKFIVIRDPDTKKALAHAAYDQMFVAEAGVVIVVCGFPDAAYSRMGSAWNSWAVDTTIAMEHIILQAEEEGLGTCWIGAFREDDAKSLLGVPDNARILGMTPLGRPAERPSARARKPFDEIVSYDKY